MGIAIQKKIEGKPYLVFEKYIYADGELFFLKKNPAYKMISKNGIYTLYSYGHIFSVKLNFIQAITVLGKKYLNEKDIPVLKKMKIL